MTVLLAESLERSSRHVVELYSVMKCFGSCQFLRGLWMDISSEVANLHMRPDAKNLVTPARTIHLPEQKETIHMISLLRKETSSGSVHVLAHSPTQNCLGDCFTKASAKADNLITAVQTRRLLVVDIHPDFKTLCTHGRRKFSSRTLSSSLLHNLTKKNHFR